MARRLKADDRRQQILSAAIKCFSRHGYRAASTAQLARAARVSEPVIYRHFDSKQGLFLAILDLAAADAMRMFQEVIGPLDTPIEQLRALLRLNPALTSQRMEEIYRVVLNAQTDRDPRIQAALRAHYRRYADFLSALISRAQKAGQVRADVLPAGLAWQMIHTAIGFAMLKPLEIHGHADREAVEQLMALLMEQITGGHRPPRA